MRDAYKKSETYQTLNKLYSDVISLTKEITDEKSFEEKLPLLESMSREISKWYLWYDNHMSIHLGIAKPVIPLKSPLVCNDIAVEFVLKDYDVSDVELEILDSSCSEYWFEIGERKIDLFYDWVSARKKVNNVSKIDSLYTSILSSCNFGNCESEIRNIHIILDKIEKSKPTKKMGENIVLCLFHDELKAILKNIIFYLNEFNSKNEEETINKLNEYSIDLNKWYIRYKKEIGEPLIPMIEMSEFSQLEKIVNLKRYFLYDCKCDEINVLNLYKNTRLYWHEINKLNKKIISKWDTSRKKYNDTEKLDSIILSIISAHEDEKKPSIGLYRWLLKIAP